MCLRTSVLVFVLVPFVFAGNFRLSTLPEQKSFTPELEPISEINELKSSTISSKFKLRSNAKTFKKKYGDGINSYSISLWTPERIRREKKFLEAALEGNTKAMYEAIDSGPIFDSSMGEALLLACRHGHDLVLKFLGELFSTRVPTDYVDRSLYAIAGRGHARLLPIHFEYFGNFVPKEVAIIAIGVASQHKNIAVVMGILELYNFSPGEITLIAELYLKSAIETSGIAK